ncbi:MAG: cytochrome P450 [Deltaproteobacteria bacterium]|nr:cytochrome P450 [Deltaproteobacteria bacterium]
MSHSTTRRGRSTPRGVRISPLLARRAYTNDAGRRMPGPAGSLRDLGNLRTIFSLGLLDAYQGWEQDRPGEDFLVWAGPAPHVVVVAPDSVQRVLNDSEHFARDIRPTKTMFGDGLLRQQGGAWVRRRAAASPPFKRGSLGSALPIVVEEVERLLQGWRARGTEPFRPTRDVAGCMLQILCRYLFGYRFDPERYGGRAFHSALVVLSSDSVLRHLLPRHAVAVARRRAIRRAHATLNELCADILESGGDAPFLTRLREDLTGGERTRQDVLDELRTFLIAGHETSATALNWALALLAQAPDEQEVLGREAREHTGFGHTEGLTAADRVFSETMRLYPPVPISVSVATRDTTLSGYFVPAGTRIDVCSYVVHRSRSRWTDPDVFQPSRFIGGAPPRTDYLPFLHGPHLCLGRGLAKIEVRAALSMLTERYRVSLPGPPPEVNLRLSLHPKGLRIRLEPVR